MKPTVIRMTKRIKKSKGLKEANTRMGRSEERSISFKGQGPCKHSRRMFSMQLTFLAACQAFLTLAALGFQRLRVRAKLPVSNYTTRMGTIPEAASPWLQASCFITYELILYSLQRGKKSFLQLSTGLKKPQGEMSAREVRLR